MKPRRRVLLFALSAAAIAGGAAVQAQDPRVTLAAVAARDWLALLDKGDFATAHTRASERFKTSIDPTTWGAAYKKERVNRGAVVARTMVNSTFQDTLAGTPGEFASLIYRTSFANQRDGSETVTLEREKDGVWRVVGYLIR